VCIKDPPFPTMVALSGCGGVYVLFDTVVTEANPLLSLNHMTVIPNGIDTSAGSYEVLPNELNGTVIA